MPLTYAPVRFMFYFIVNEFGINPKPDDVFTMLYLLYVLQTFSIEMKVHTCQ